MSGVFKIPYAIQPLRLIIRQFGGESASLKKLENKSDDNDETTTCPLTEVSEYKCDKNEL